MGQRLVEALNESAQRDLTVCWLAHKIAEVMQECASAEGAAKEDAERRCREHIFRLWEHKSYMPEETRPFKAFDDVFRVLATLGSSETVFYLEGRGRAQADSDGARYMEIAQSLDHSTKRLLRWLLAMSVIEASEREKVWLGEVSALELPNDAEFAAVQSLREATRIFAPTGEADPDQMDELRSMRNALNFTVELATALGIRLEKAITDHDSAKTERQARSQA